MTFAGSYSLRANAGEVSVADVLEAEQLHCHSPGGQNCQDSKVQLRNGVGEGAGQETAVGITVGTGLGRLRVRVGVGGEDWQPAPTMTAARRNKITKGFSMTTVIYDLPLSKVNYRQKEEISIA